MLNIIQNNRILKRGGKWYTQKRLDFLTDYYYVKGLGESFGHPYIAGHHIELHKTLGDSHRFATIHLDCGLNYERIIASVEVKDQALIKKLDSALGVIFYNL